MGSFGGFLNEAYNVKKCLAHANYEKILFFLQSNKNAMKKIIISITLILCALVVTNCSRKMIDPSNQNDGQVVIPCDEWLSPNDEYIVGLASFESRDMFIAMSNASDRANSELQKQINTKIEMAFKDQATKRAENESVDQESFYSNKDITNLTSGSLSNAEIVCEKVFKNTTKVDGNEVVKYTAHVAVRLSKDDLINAAKSTEMSNTNINLVELIRFLEMQ